MLYHPVVKRITNLLEQYNFWFETFEHEPVRTSEEASRVRPEYTLSQGAKALIIRIKDSENKKRFVMVVVPGDKKFNAKKVKKFLEIKDLSFATEDEIAVLTGGVEIGGVPPFGNLFNLEVIADSSLFEHEKIIFNAGDRSFSVAMFSDDYRRLVNPKICDIISS